MGRLWRQVELVHASALLRRGTESRVMERWRLQFARWRLQVDAVEASGSVVGNVRALDLVVSRRLQVMHWRLQVMHWRLQVIRWGLQVVIRRLQVVIRRLQVMQWRLQVTLCLQLTTGEHGCGECRAELVVTLQ